MKQANLDVRNYAKTKNIPLWEIAYRLGINDGNFSRKLRRELPDEEKQRIFNIIDELKEAR